MNREKYTDYLLRKIEYLEKNYSKVQEKCEKFEKIAEETREIEENEVEICKKWIENQEKKDQKMQCELETMKSQMDSLKRKSYEKSIDNQEELIQKVEQLGENLKGLMMNSDGNPDKNTDFEREMKAVTGWMMKEEKKDLEILKTIDVFRLSIQNLKKEIDSGKVNHQLLLSSASNEIKAIRSGYEEAKSYQNDAHHQLHTLTSRLNETEFYAEQMCHELAENKLTIQQLTAENRFFREENSRFQKQMCESFRALREEMRAKEHKMMLQIKKEPPRATENQKLVHFGEYCPEVIYNDSVEIIEQPPIQIVQEVLATWRGEDAEKDTECPEDIISTVSITLAPCQPTASIQHLIIGEWKLIYPDDMELRKLANMLEIPKEYIKIFIDGPKLTTYFNNGTDYVKQECFEFGNPDGVKNYWHIQNDSIISVDFNGYCKKTDKAERCTRSIVDGKLLMVNEIRGIISSKVYEKISF